MMATEDVICRWTCKQTVVPMKVKCLHCRLLERLVRGQRSKCVFQIAKLIRRNEFAGGVYAYVFGDILGSEIRVDEVATRQLVNERRFINEDLMPLMVGGGKLTLDVLASVDDRTGEKFSATLRGLTRALAFADEFVSDGS